MIAITACPSCGSRDIRKVCQDWIGTYQGKSFRVPKLTYHECPQCGEQIYSREAMQQIEAHSRAYAKRKPKPRQLAKSA